MVVAITRLNGAVSVSTGNVNSVLINNGAITAPGDITSTGNVVSTNNLYLNGTTVNAPTISNILLSIAGNNASFWTTVSNITTIDPIANAHVATMEWVVSQLTGYLAGYTPIGVYSNFYDPTNGLPVGPAIGDGYVALTTANGWVKNDLYKWDGTIWVHTVVQIGYTATIKNTAPSSPYVITFGTQNTWNNLGFNYYHDWYLGKEMTVSQSSPVITLNQGTYTNYVMAVYVVPEGSDFTVRFDICALAQGFVGYIFGAWVIRISNVGGTVGFDINKQTIKSFGTLTSTTFGLSVQSGSVMLSVSYTSTNTVNWHATLEATYTYIPSV